MKTETEKEFKPYVAADQQIPEFTVQAVVLGFILSVVFNAANAYLGLKIGLTVSASIPSAIISMGVLRILLPKILGRDGTILENNIVHTIAATGEALAGAIIFTVPAILFLGGTISNTKVFILGSIGGILGMLMMIPLRQSLMVHEHHNLPFPEGTACAKVLIAGDKGAASAGPVFKGILVGGIFKFAMSALNLFKDTLMWTFPKLEQAGFGFEISPLLVGVGYLVGLEIASVMLAGGVLGYCVLIPLIHAIGGHNIIFPGTVPIDQMDTAMIAGTYIRYIGAGGVAFGGFVSLAKSIPDIKNSLKHSLAALMKVRASKAQGDAAKKDPEIRAVVFGGIFLGLLVGAFAWEFPWTMGPADWPQIARLLCGTLLHFVVGGGAGAILGAGITYAVAKASLKAGSAFARTELDIPLPVVGIGVLGLFLLLWLVPAFELSFIEAVIVVLFCFFFVAVSARMVGLIGTTNQPISGMTITALLSMTLLFVLLGHNPLTIKTAAIMGGAAVCIAISLSGDLSQDLKTAALLGGTPWKVQIAEIMGTMVSAVRTGFILWILFKAYGFGAPTPEHPHALAAPQATLMAKLVIGATGGRLPWLFLLTGAGIGLVTELCGISSLALAIGLYLPITNWPMIWVGGVLAWYAARKKGKKDDESDPGSLFASGLIAGDALMGIALAMITVVGWDTAMMLRNPELGNPIFEDFLSAGLYAGIVWLLYRYATNKEA